MLSYKKHYPPCHMNALLALRPCKAFGRSTSGIHARPLSKVRCCRPKEFGRLPEGLLYTHQPFQKRTIPCPAPSHLPPLLKVRCCRPKKIRATTGGIALHPPTSPSPATVAKSQPPLTPHHVLALLAPVAPNTATFASIFLIQYTNYG